MTSINDKDWKSIKEIANEIGVSKTTVRKAIENLGLRSNLRTIGNQLAIDNLQESLIKRELLTEKEAESKTLNCEQSQTEKCEVSDLVCDFQEQISAKNMQISQLTDEISILKSMIDTLQVQLKVKDEQIEGLTSELVKEREHSREASERFAILADQSQKLQLAQMQQQLIEAKEEVKEHNKHWWQKWF